MVIVSGVRVGVTGGLSMNIWAVGDPESDEPQLMVLEGGLPFWRRRCCVLLLENRTGRWDVGSLRGYLLYRDP